MVVCQGEVVCQVYQEEEVCQEEQEEEVCQVYQEEEVGRGGAGRRVLVSGSGLFACSCCTGSEVRL